MADKRLLGNIALPEYSRLVYNLDSEGAGIHIENKDDHRIFNVLVDSETIMINSENELYLPIDGVTIYFDDSEQVLKAAGLDVKPGEAIYLEDSEENGLIVKYVNVKYDSETILLNSENELFVPLDYETIVINSEGKVALPIDRKTIFVDSEDGLLKAAGLIVSEGNAIRIENSEIDGVALATIHVRYDSETIVLSSEGNLTVPIDRRTIIVNSEGKVAIPIDEKTIFVDSETGLLKAAGLTVSEGEAIRIETSEVDGVEQATIHVRYDDLTIHLSSENELELHPDEDRAFAVDSEGKLFVKIDGLTIRYNSEGQLVSFPEPLHDGVATHVVYGTSEWDSEAINVLFDSERGLDVDSENQLYVKVDGDTVRFNSEGELEAKIILEGEANHIYDSEGNLKIDVLYDDITIHLNSENELELHLDTDKAIDVDSEGKLFVKADDLSIKYDSEGRLYANLDEETTVLDSEGRIHTNIDYDTLIINSEGFIAVDRLTVPEVDAIWYSIVI